MTSSGNSYFPVLMRKVQRTAKYVSLSFLLLYAFTAQRGVSWQDSGFIQLRLAALDLAGVDGLACSHPLYFFVNHNIVGFISPLFLIDNCTAANVCSAFWMALALFTFFRIAFLLTHSRKAALLAALTLGLSHLAWWLSTIAEIYTMSLFLLMGEIFCTVRLLSGDYRRWLYPCAALFSGLGFAVHNYALLSLPLTAFAIFSVFLRKKRNILAFLFFSLSIFAVWAAGAFFILLPAYREITAGYSPYSVISDLLFGRFSAQVAGVNRSSLALAIANLGIAALSLSSPCWIIGAIRICRTPKAFRHPVKFFSSLSPATRYISAIFIIHFAFAIHYRVPDQALFFLPSLSLAALLLALVLASNQIIADRRFPAITLAATTVAFSIAFPMAANMLLHRPALYRMITTSRARLLPFRDEVRYWTLPWKHNENSAEKFARIAVNLMNEMPDASLYADSTSAPPIMMHINSKARWNFYNPWNDNSRLPEEISSGRTVFAVSPVKNYCPHDALATGKILPLFP